MATVREIIKSTAARFREAGVDSPRRTAEWMIQDLLDLDRSQLLISSDKSVSARDAARLGALADRRVSGEPLQYILGHAPFRDFELHVNPSVLIPRPETERVVDRALDLLDQGPILDIGTGSGCVAIAVARERPNHKLVACDVSAKALEVASFNANALGVAIEFLQADVLDPAFPSAVRSPFGMVISNPPYVTNEDRKAMQKEVLEHEPDLALFAGDQALRFYAAISGHASRLLRPGGHVVLEINEAFATEVSAILTEDGFEETHIYQDLAGRDRVVTGSWPE